MKPTLPIVIIGVALLGLFGYHNIHAHQQGQARLIRQQVAHAEADQQAQAEVASLLLRVEQYRKRLAPAPDPSWLVREAVALGKQAGVQLGTITQETPLPFKQFTRVAVTLQLKASYHQLGAFLDQVERSNRFIRVEQLDLSSTSNQSGGPGSVQLVLSTLYVPPVGEQPGS